MVKRYLFVAVLLSLTARSLYGLDVDVLVGEDIQAAIDRVSKSNGGSVTLAAGIHEIDRSIRLRNGVVLKGKGSAVTTIKTDKVIKMIEGASEGLSNVTIENLKLTGVAVDGSHAIHIISYKREHKNLTVRGVHAMETGWGVHIKGADGVVIEDCEFIKNGAKGKEKFAHNLYLRRCKNVLVRNTKLNASTSGNGCNISYSKNILIDNCEAKDNYFRGIRAADTDGFVVRNSKIGRNGDVGLIANQEKVATKNIKFINNVIFSNRGGGVFTKRSVTGVVKMCNSFDNKKWGCTS